MSKAQSEATARRSRPKREIQHGATLLTNILAGVRLLVASAKEWDALPSLARANQLSGYVGQCLRDFRRAPASIRHRLQADHKNMVALDIMADRIVREVGAVLRDGGVRCIPLKGAALRHLVYPDPAFRSAVDIDLLVRPGELQSADDIMRSAGFERISDEPGRPVTAATFHERGFYRPTTKTLVEIHDNLSQPQRFRIDTNDLWARAWYVDQIEKKLKKKLENLPFPPDTLFLSPEDTLIHQFIHNAAHLFNIPLRSILDIKLIIETLSPNWDDVIRRARTARASAAAYFTLKIAKNLLAADVPDDVLDALRPNRVREQWLSLFLSEKPVRSKTNPEAFSGFFRFDASLRVKEALVGLAVIDGFIQPATFALSYLVLRIEDLLANGTWGGKSIS
jgi:hypothetical protein